MVVFDNQGELRKELWLNKFAAGKISLVKFIRKIIRYIFTGSCNDLLRLELAKYHGVISFFKPSISFVPEYLY